MLENIIHINNPKDDDGVEVLLEMIRPNTIKPVFRKLKTTDNQFVREKERVTKVNQLEQVSKALLWKKTMEYQSMLHALKIDENVFKPRAKIDRYIALLLLACFPAFMLGLVINIIPFALAKYIADTKNKYIEFYTSILLSAALGAYLIYWGALTLIASRFDGNWWLWAAISLPVLMVFCLYYRAYWKNFINNWRWGHCPADLKVKILKVRSVIIESIEG